MTVRTKKPYALTAMQQSFVDHYLMKPIGQRNVHRAALAAGYSPHTAHAQGRKLLQNQLIRKKIMDQTPARAIEMAHIDSAWMLSELACLWETPLSALFNGDGTLRPITELSREAQKLVTSFEVHELTEYNDKGDKVRVRTRVGKIKLIDRLRVLEDIGKHTKVNAFGTREKADANESFADMLRAASALLKKSTLTELDVTPGELESG